MKITEEQFQKIKFDELSAGEVFKAYPTSETYYLKIKEVEGFRFNCVDMNNGTMHNIGKVNNDFNKSDVVYKVNGEYVVK